MFGLSLEEWAIIAAALIAGGLVKGVTGVGLPLVAVPILAGFLGVERAVLILVIPALVLNLYQVVLHRAEAASMPEWRRMILAGIPGAVVGATVLHLASDRALATALGVWILAYLGLRLMRPEFRLTLRARMRWSPLVGGIAGALQAATGISAPVVAAYADALGLRPHAYVFAVCAPFGAFAAAHLAVITASGLYTPDLLAQSLFAVVPAVAAIPFGMWLRGRIGPAGFDRLIRILLAVMAGRLLYAAWA